jgi:hypothetical protein
MIFIPDITKEWPAMFLGAEVKGFHEHPDISRAGLFTNGDCRLCGEKL